VQKLVDRYVAEKRFQRLRRDLREQCDKIAPKGLLREAGHRLQVISPLFKWAVSRDLIEVSPVVGLSAGDYSLGEVRDRVLADDEVWAFWLDEELAERHALV
jgi:hypothetical protein